MRLDRSTWGFLLLIAALAPACGGGRRAHPGPLRHDARVTRCGETARGSEEPKCASLPDADGRLRPTVHNNQHENGLTPEALRCEAHLLETLTRSPLSSATFQGLRGRAREELAAECPHARELMKYVVSCALGPGESVTAEPDCEPWRGEVGLCKSGEFGDWASGSPTTPCLEIVSACVLARTNAMDKRVAVSLRGPHPALSTRRSVPVETHYRHQGGRELIDSFHPCKGGEGGLPDRNCGWQPRYVGKCAADDDGAGDVTLSVTNGGNEPVMVRVCAGIHGCDHGERRKMPSYAEWLADQTLTAPGGTLSFDCPSGHTDKTTNETHGYYSVMIASPAPQGDVPCDVDVQAVTAREGSYPASEDQVFVFREGAFYGNLFLPGGDRTNRPRAPTAQFACFSQQSKANQGDLYLDRRVCLSPKEGCFANRPEPCWTSCDARSVSHGGYLQSCNGGSAVWRYPITTYLNAPDDLVDLLGGRRALPDNPPDPVPPPR